MPPPLTCGAATRPGIADRGGDGVWRGRAVEVCRAIAERAGGPGAPIVFHGYDSAAALRAAADDGIAFVAADERAAVPALRAGPIVATGRQVLAVLAASPVTRAGDLTGELVCFLVGTRAEDALDAWAASAGVAIERLPFQEPDEMRDAVDVGRCAAAAVDAAELRSDGATRVLEPALAVTPIMAATSSAHGQGWRAALAAVMARQDARGSGAGAPSNAGSSSATRDRPVNTTAPATF